MFITCGECLWTPRGQAKAHPASHNEDSSHPAREQHYGGLFSRPDNWRQQECRQDTASHVAECHEGASAFAGVGPQTMIPRKLRCRRQQAMTIDFGGDKFVSN